MFVPESLYSSLLQRARDLRAPVGEWLVATDGMRAGRVLGSFMVLLALAYLGADLSSGRYPSVFGAGFISTSCDVCV